MPTVKTRQLSKADPDLRAGQAQAVNYHSRYNSSSELKSADKSALTAE